MIYLDVPPDDGQKRSPNDAPGRYRLVEEKRVDADRLRQVYETRVNDILAKA